MGGGSHLSGFEQRGVILVPLPAPERRVPTGSREPPAGQDGSGRDERVRRDGRRVRPPYAAARPTVTARHPPTGSSATWHGARPRDRSLTRTPAGRSADARAVPARRGGGTGAAAGRRERFTAA